MAETRPYGPDDARQDALVEAFKRHVHAARLDAVYDADIEYMGEALLAFTDDCVLELERENAHLREAIHAHHSNVNNGVDHGDADVALYAVLKPAFDEKERGNG
jgi:hypothetical protein